MSEVDPLTWLHDAEKGFLSVRSTNVLENVSQLGSGRPSLLWLYEPRAYERMRLLKNCGRLSIREIDAWLRENGGRGLGGYNGKFTHVGLEGRKLAEAYKHERDVARLELKRWKERYRNLVKEMRALLQKERFL